MPTYDYKLVRLPRVNGINKDFYGIGYFSENGDFIFSIIKPEMPVQPLRTISAKSCEDKEYNDENFIEIIGNIESFG